MWASIHNFIFSNINARRQIIYSKSGPQNDQTEDKHNIQLSSKYDKNSESMYKIAPNDMTDGIIYPYISNEEEKFENSIILDCNIDKPIQNKFKCSDLGQNNDLNKLTHSFNNEYAYNINP